MSTALPMTAARMVHALRAEGLTPVENDAPDWRHHDRNHISHWGPVAGVAIHHTAGTDSLTLVTNGTSELPGPLCHAHLAKDGTLTLISGGRANHFGGMAQNAYDALVEQASVHPAPDVAEPVDGNTVTYGIEIENLGDGEDPYPQVQYETAVKWAAAICRHHGWTADAVIGHAEGTARKIDPSFPMADFRAAVTAQLQETVMPVTLVEVRDKVLNPDGTPARGQTIYVPSGGIKNGDVAYAATRVVASWDEGGECAVDLVAADDEGTEPEGLTYAVVRRVRSSDGTWLAPQSVGSIEVLAEDEPTGIDLPERATVEVMPEFVQYALSVAGVEPNPATGDVPLTADTLGALRTTGGEVTGTVTTHRAAATDSVVAGIVGAEAFDRVRLLANGTIEVGPGSGARDTNWRRSGANEWTTDDSVIVSLMLRHMGATLGFFGASATTKPTVSGSTGGNAALASLCTALASLGLITDSTTA
ncbi:N-acetylmuramoyl-L-alanine amidase [Streptomyces griseoincarnatus]